MPDVIQKQIDEIERLTAERDNYKDRWEQTGCTRHFAMEASMRLNKGYRERIAELEYTVRNLQDKLTLRDEQRASELEELAEKRANK